MQTLISGQYLLLMEYYCILHEFILFSLFLNILYEVCSVVKTSAKSRFLWILVEIHFDILDKILTTILFLNVDSFAGP